MTGLRVLVLTGDRDAWADVARELAERRHNLVFDDPGDEPVAVLVADGPNGERWAQAASRRAAHPDALLVAVIDPGKPEEVVTALESGASHCLPRPVRPSALIVLLERAARKPQPPPPPPGGQVGFHGMVGNHPAMQQLVKRVMQVAKSRATVLLSGESGTGKELIAAAIHRESKRAAGPFVRLNCASLAPTVLESELFGHEKGAFTGATTRRRGRFEHADGGTLFLDEISEAPPEVQVKLLRFLQERELERVGSNETIRVDVRVIAATNRRLDSLVEDGAFREDLFYRLAVVQLEVPPLRARKSDVPHLADLFMRRFAEENEKTVHGFTERARWALLAHPWPGNVRELQNALEQAVLLAEGEEIDLDDLPLAQAPPAAEAIRLLIPGVTLAELERFAILETLKAVGGSKSRAAEVLGISRRTIQYRLKEWGLGGKTDEDGEGDDA
ncbi:MAG: sigma-54 dependent transcriptional regulator [Sandaracinaceae bacterium]|nr:MAG: sigma-54-dependent Fis family transcriptional regulator [Sandaracinaceae bacterium]